AEALAAAGVVPPAAPVRVAVAAGPAFSFRYEENLELLRAAGAGVLEFDPLASRALPEGADGLLLGGGFPEAFAGELCDAGTLREAVRAFAAAGHPVAAECGGMLFLCRELDGRAMCGVIDASARMTDGLTLGYREAEAPADSALARSGWRLRGHEFHYSSAEPAAGRAPAWRLETAGGSRAEGFVQGGVHASYLHTHWAATPEVAARFVASAGGAGRRPERRAA
ncbi:MAG: cobyrinate a,c-diamide synthase, partial [Thermoleophilaceae bacterium]